MTKYDVYHYCMNKIRQNYMTKLKTSKTLTPDPMGSLTKLAHYAGDIIVHKHKKKLDAQ